MLDRCVVVFVTFAFFAKISFFFLSDFIDYTVMHMEESSDKESSDNDELPPANLPPLERVENLYQSDCSNERRKKNYERIRKEKQWLPRKMNPNLRTTAMMSLQSRIMRSRDMNRLRFHRVKK